jgi:hypothetical protein
MPSDEQFDLDFIDVEATDFEFLETEFSMAFKKRISCLAHTTQLVLRAVFDTKLPSCLVLRKTRALCGRFRVSHKASALLSKAILLPGETRWGSTFLMVSRVLEIHEEINKVKFYK